MYVILWAINQSINHEKLTTPAFLSTVPNAIMKMTFHRLELKRARDSTAAVPTYDNDSGNKHETVYSTYHSCKTHGVVPPGVVSYIQCARIYVYLANEYETNPTNNIRFKKLHLIFLSSVHQYAYLCYCDWKVL